MGGNVNTKWLIGKVRETPTGLVNNSNTVFTLSQTPGQANEVSVYLDGLYETEYTLNLSTREITFTTAPEVGQQIKVEYRPES